MAHADTPPYLIPADDAFAAQPWFRRTGTGTRPLATALTDWDYATGLSLERRLNVDYETVRRSTASGDRFGLGVLVTAESSSTRIKRILYRESIDEGGSVFLSLDVSPEALGGSVALGTVIYVDSPDPTSALSPTRQGSILWSDVAKVVLEADAARVPLQIVDFRSSGYPAEAPWLIEIDDADLDAPASTAIRVYINRSHPEASAMASEPESTEKSRLLADSLELALAQRLLQVVVASDEFDGDAGYANGSLGESLSSLMSLHFPEYSRRSLAAAQERQPWILETTLASSLGVYQL